MVHAGNSRKAHGAEPNRTLTRTATAQSRKSNRLQDAVYREMFFLEAKKPGAEMGLALALLRAMAASEKMANREEILNWLSMICPHCLKMIESALDEYCACAPCALEDTVSVAPAEQ